MINHHKTYWLYLIKVSGTTRHKIGITQKAVKNRRLALQTANPDPLITIARAKYASNRFALEAEKRYLDLSRERGTYLQGEWSDMPTDKAIAQYIEVCDHVRNYFKLRITPEGGNG